MIISLLVTCPGQKVSMNLLLVPVPNKSIDQIVSCYFSLQKSTDYFLLINIPHKK